MQVGSRWRFKRNNSTICSFLKVWPKNPLIRISEPVFKNKPDLTSLDLWNPNGRWRALGISFFPLRISENSNLPSYSAGPETCRLGAGCELLQGGQLQPGPVGASGRCLREVTRQSSRGERVSRWRVRMGLPEGKAQHQTVLESSRNSEQRDLKEKGGPREAVEGTQTLWSIFCKTVTQPDFF